MTAISVTSDKDSITTGFQPLVLVAGEEPKIADILIAYLERSGFRTAHALDGQLPLAMHQSLKPDLILLDVLMPDMDGWKVLAEVRHRGNKPVIMLTAQNQDMDKVIGLRLGADDYVVKPFNPTEVVARTQAVLRRSIVFGNRVNAATLRVGAFEIDVESYEVIVSVASESVPFKPPYYHLNDGCGVMRNCLSFAWLLRFLNHAMGVMAAPGRTVE